MVVHKINLELQILGSIFKLLSSSNNGISPLGRKILVTLQLNPQSLLSNQLLIKISKVAFNNSPCSLQISSNNSHSSHSFLNFKHNKVNSRHKISFPHSSQLHKYNLVRINKPNKMGFNLNRPYFKLQICSNQQFNFHNQILSHKPHLFLSHRLGLQHSSDRPYLNL
jgi:hypothetical protein